jgi:DeoR/GlpR family transcriptional regulator of sugar metabolism
VLLDGGTTCVALARQLKAQHDLYVATNNLVAVMTLANAPGVKITLVSGD